MCMSEGKVYSHVSSSYAVMLDNLLLHLIHVYEVCVYDKYSIV